MKTVWKYPIRISDDPTLATISGVDAKPVHVGHDPAGAPCVWIEVEPARGRTEVLAFLVVGTGHPIPGTVAEPVYVGSLHDGPFVWHVYQVDPTGLVRG